MAIAAYRDEEFGVVRVHIDSRARRLIFRVGEGELRVTCPVGYPESRIRASVEENRAKLRRLAARATELQASRTLAVGDRVPCYGGDILLLPGIHSSRFLFRYEGDCLQVFCPPGVDLNHPVVRKRLSAGVCRFVYRRAQELLPRRLERLSRRWGVSPAGVTIGRGRRKLGHCTARGEIQLSLHLMFLSEELIDYVICHELAHLTYMNHSPRFHALCNRYCDGKELLLRKQLRSFVFLFG